MMRELLFYGMEWCERHPLLMAGGIVVCMALVGALDRPA